MILLRATVVTATLLVVLGCHSGEEPRIQRESLLPEWRGLVLGAELWRVGAYDGPEHEALGRIGGVAFVNSELVIADELTGRVHWYAEQGMHINSMGGLGRGPGEFVAPRGIAALPDGNVAVVNIGGNSAVILGRDGEYVDQIAFPGSLQEICALPHHLVALGVRSDVDAPLHLLDPVSGQLVGSLGGAPAGVLTGPHRQRLLGGLIQGAVECLTDSVVYARSSDGSISLVDSSGRQRWITTVPGFIPMVHVPESRGVRHGPAEGAREMHGFAAVWYMDGVLIAQIWRVDVRDDEVSLYTIFLDAISGALLGSNTTTPLILATGKDRMALAPEDVVPTVIVVSASIDSSISPPSNGPG